MPLGFGVVLFSVFILIDAERTLTQKDLFLTKRVGNTVNIRCEASGLSSGDYVHWYQKKDEEPLRRVLYISYEGSRVPDSTLTKEEKESFSTEKTPSPYDLKIQKLQEAHTAIYYCACWETRYRGAWIKIFGSGTKLIVTEAKVEPPTVIAFPPSKPHDGKTTLLCIAKSKFPDVIYFKWKEEDKEVTGSENMIMEQTIDDGRASMLIIDKATVEKKHTCIVQHNTAVEEKNIPKGGTDKPLCNNPESNRTLPDWITDDFALSRSLYLSSLTYTLMILKSAAYFGFASLIMCKRFRK